jgi:hypothetical protein
MSANPIGIVPAQYRWGAGPLESYASGPAEAAALRYVLPMFPRRDATFINRNYREIRWPFLLAEDAAFPHSPHLTHPTGFDEHALQFHGVH